MNKYNRKKVYIKYSLNARQLSSHHYDLSCTHH